MEKSLQDTYGPNTICFGCGPANEKGLRIKSYVSDDEVVCTFIPEKHHEAFEGVVNGGIIGVILDCHCNWTAAYAMMKAQGLEHPPCTVTAELHLYLKRPTPSGTPLFLRARAVEIEGRRAVVEGQLEAQGKITATCRAEFVAVTEGHPAWHRW